MGTGRKAQKQDSQRLMMAAAGEGTLQHDCLAQKSHGREDTGR
jgi:hypothetical protein